MPTLRTKLINLVLAAPLLLAGGIAACSHQTAESSEGAGKSPDSAVPVTLTRVTQADIQRSISVTGSIAALPNQDVRVSSFVAGRIAELKVAEGDHVRAGQIVARLEDHTLRDQFKQAEATVAQARASLENAKLSRTRNETLFQKGIAARKELEDARTQESVAQASLQQAEAALSVASFQVGRAEIHSPLDGTVVKRFVNVGEQVDGTAAQPIVEIAHLAEVELQANIPAASLGFLKVGQKLPLSTEIPGAASFEGRVVAISQAVDSVTNSGMVRIRTLNRSGALRLGMFLSAQVVLETHAGAAVVPPQAVYLDEARTPHVYRVEGDTAIATPVKVGIETPSLVEILSGPKPGDAVILNGGYGLTDKAKIRVQGEPKQ
jgi:RND family efflux transporter MFP subunit